MVSATMLPSSTALEKLMACRFFMVRESTKAQASITEVAISRSSSRLMEDRPSAENGQNQYRLAWGSYFNQSALAPVALVAGSSGTAAPATAGPATLP